MGMVYNIPLLVRFPATRLRIVEGFTRRAAGLSAGLLWVAAA